MLYVSFAYSERVIGIELVENVLLRLDVGHETEEQPKAIGLTVINFERMLDSNLSVTPRVPPLPEKIEA